MILNVHLDVDLTIEIENTVLTAKHDGVIVAQVRLPSFPGQIVSESSRQERRNALCGVFLSALDAAAIRVRFAEKAARAKDSP